MYLALVEHSAGQGIRFNNYKSYRLMFEKWCAKIGTPLFLLGTNGRFWVSKS